MTEPINPNNSTPFVMSGKTYDFIKRLVQLIIPALSSLYFGLAQIWGLPAAEQVVGTSALVTTFLGVCLGISSNRYESSGAAYDGSLIINTSETGAKSFLLQADEDLESLEGKKSISFKIEPN